MAPLLWLVLPASSLRSRHPVRRTQVNLTCWSPTKRLAPDVVTTASEPSRLATRPHILLPPLLLLSCRVPTAWQLLQLARGKGLQERLTVREPEGNMWPFLYVVTDTGHVCVSVNFVITGAAT